MKTSSGTEENEVMSDLRRLPSTDDALIELADLVYGGGLGEPIAKMNPAGSDLNTGAKGKSKKVTEKTTEKIAGKKETPEWQKNVALATNTAGAIAGPAAIYQAYKNRKEGGMPRAAARSGKLGGTARKVAGKLDRAAGYEPPKGDFVPPKPKGSGKAKALAIGAGGTMVGLQMANMAGDTIAARMLAQDKQKNKAAKATKKVEEKVKKTAPRLIPIEPVHKSIDEIPEVKDKGKKKLTEAVEMKPSDKVIACSTGKLKKLPTGRESKRVKKSVEYDIRWDGEISKVNTDKQQVFGWASIVEMDGEPIVDLQGDYIAIDEVEKSAYEYVHKSRKGGDMHLRDGDQPVHKSDMIESFVVTPEKKEALGLPETTPIGWWVGYQINDPELWDNVKSGKRTAFSIHGRGMRSPYEA